jgi:catechol 2,3-dioxygenase-like lactoylglutathione lyase family enzyme
MTIQNLAIVSVPVADAERARKFYVDTLGFELIRDEPMDPGSRWIQVGPKGGQTSLTLVTWFEAMPPGSLQGVVLETPDIDAAHARLRARGLAIGEVRSEPWGCFATFRDPDGNGFVLQQSAAYG